MSAESRSTLKGHFNTGDKPTEAQFANLIDSGLNLTDGGTVAGIAIFSSHITASGNISASGTIIANSFQSTTGEELDLTSDANIDINAVTVDIDASDNITLDAADDIALTTSTADGLITLHSAHTAGQAILIDANANAGSILDIDAGIIDIDVQGAATLDAVGVAIGAGSGELDLTTTGTMDINSAALDIDTSGAVTIDAAGAASNISIVTAHTAGVAFHLDADANAGSIVDIDAGILDIDVTAGTTLNTTSLTVTSATGTAAGGGIDAVSPTINVSRIGRDIVTEVFIDIGAGLILSSGATGDVIGEDGVANAFVTQITTAINGLVYAGEIVCLEVPTTGDPDINVAANASGTIAEDAAGEGEHVLANCGVHTLALKTAFTIPAGGIVDDFIYLTHGGTTAGTYDAGKFLLRFFGTPTS